MKTLVQHPLMIYAVAGVACLCIMIIVDYLMGSNAQHLNAYSIIQQLLGNHSAEKSLIVQKIGLSLSVMVTLVVNFIIGLGLIQILKLLINLLNP